MFKFISMLLTGVAFCIIAPCTTNAQDKEMTAAAHIFATEFCNCISPHLKALDKDVTTALIEMPSDEAEMDAYFSKFDEAFIERFVADMETIQRVSESDEYLACMEGIENKMERFKDKLDSHYKEDEHFLNTVLEELENSSKCQLAYVLMKLGLSAE